jgi:uncharacterized repeat protein (TIGR03833 family)
MSLVKVQNRNNPSGDLISGIVKEILTEEFSHPSGIEVLLENGIVGRVKEIIDSDEQRKEKNQSDQTIIEGITELEKKRLVTSNVLNQLKNELENKKEYVLSETQSLLQSNLSDLEEKCAAKKDELDRLENKIEIARKHLLMNGDQLDTSQKSETKTTSFPADFDITKDTLMKQNIGILERQFRKMITYAFKDIPNWWKTRIPGDVKLKAVERKKEYENSGALRELPEYELIEFVDFPEYRKIIIEGKNWDEAFSKILPKNKKDVFIIKMEELEAIRNHLYHNRKINDIDAKRFEVYYNDIMTFISDFEKKDHT